MDTNDEHIIILGPGRYEVGPQGHIKIYGARHFEMQGCTITPAPEQNDNA